MNKFKSSILFLFLALSMYANASLFAQVSVNQVTRFDGGDAYGTPSAVTLDAAGNVYFTGYFDRKSVDTSYEISTFRYNQSGTFSWVSRWGAKGTYSKSTSIAVDSKNSIYVGGYTYSASSQADFLILKYSSSGVLLWSRTYDNGLNDYLQKITVDINDNVYVTGNSEGLTTGYDFLTVKYDSAGNYLWNARYTSTGNNPDNPSGITVDNSGNVYVTGYSTINGNTDIVTVKYNQNSAQQWVRTYTGSGGNDFAVDIKKDLSGNVFVAGYSFNVSKGNYDLCTIKYSPAGSVMYSALYNSTYNNNDYTTSLYVDKSGNAFITGYANRTLTNSDYITVAYNSAGTQVWAALYERNSGQNDQAAGIAGDSTGNIYVSGTTYSTITQNDLTLVKYNKKGVFQWAQSYNNPDSTGDYCTSVAVDPSGTSYVLGKALDKRSNSNFAAVKFTASGVAEWDRLARSFNPVQDMSAGATDAQGNLYVAGSVHKDTSANIYYLVLIKYNSAGVMQWMRKTGFSYPYNKFFKIIVNIDNTGNPVVSGTISSSNISIFAVKYNSSGTQLWVNNYSISGFNVDLTETHTDASGNIWLLAQSLSTQGTGGTNIVLVYSPSGSVLWSNVYGSFTGSRNSFAVEGTANAYVANTNGSAGWQALKFNSSGAQVILTVNQPGALVSNVKLASDGYLYAAGVIPDSGKYDLFVTKFSTSGTVIWSTRLDNNEITTQPLEMMIGFAQGKVYCSPKYRISDVTGTSISAYCFNSAAGSFIWKNQFFSLNFVNMHGRKLLTDAAGSIYIGGYCYPFNFPTGNTADFIAVKYNQAGDFVWSVTYNNPKYSLNNDVFWDMSLNGTDSLCLIGNSRDKFTDDITSVKLMPSGMNKPSKQLSENLIPGKTGLTGCYPNPFNPVTNISFSIAAAGNVSLEVFDIKGSLVSVVLNGQFFKTGTHSVAFNGGDLSSGIYFCRLTYHSGGSLNFDTKKIILVK